MPATAYLEFIIEYPDESKRTISVDSDVVTVGSGAHCEIRLPSDDVPVEQLRMEARGGGVFGEARSMTPPALLNGLPFTRGRLLPNTTLQVGPFKLQVACVEGTARPKVSRARERRTNPAIWVVAAIGFPLGIYLLIISGPEPSMLGAAPAVPSLWSTVEAGACIHSDPAVAEAQAASYLEQADARRERSPFSPQDAVESVSLYARAATCFSQARDTREAELANREAEQMRHATARQFHIHQVRLERALATKKYDFAQAEARILQAFVGSTGGEYSGWLSDLQRRIEVTFSGKAVNP